MKEERIINGWYIRQKDERFSCPFDGPLYEKDGWIWAGKADQVQKVLLDRGILDERVSIGETERCAWIEQEEWIYACDFECSNSEMHRIAFLKFGGVDLFADFYLNGEYIGSHQDMLIPKRIEVSGKLQKHNRLWIHFYSTRQKMEELFNAMDDEFKRNGKRFSMVRKGFIEFGDAGKVSMLTVGLYADVVLQTYEKAEIFWPDIDYTFDYWYRWVKIHITAHISGNISNLQVETLLTDPDGQRLMSKQVAIIQGEEGGVATTEMQVDHPALWWPVHYGQQPLYCLEFILKDGDTVLDRAKRKIGLRNVEKTGDMRFRINGKEIKQWGCLIEPYNGLTHRWDSKKNKDMLALALHANMNTLRIWGGSMQFDDEFYDECDRLGILVWHEFCLCWHPAPDTPSYTALYRAEAAHEVRRVKHHPCVLLYCGGNESEVGFVEGLPEKLSNGWTPFMRDFKNVCQQLDPHRFYLDSSPCGGDYPSDPREGDSHPLYYTYRHAITQYPLFLSEQARSTTGPLRSLRKFMSDDELWPEGYVNQVTASQYNPNYNITHPDMPYYQLDSNYEEKYNNVCWGVVKLKEGTPFTAASWKKVPVPNTWWRRAASFFASECAPLEKFFDAENIQELVYRINAATAWFFKDDLERIRRGKPHYEIGEPRRCQGYIYVKLNDTWPQFYCTLIDYFQEVYIPYYQFRRSLSPILLSFDFQDRIFLWGVNDTSEDILGTLNVRVFSQILNRIVNEFSIPVSIEAGESKVLTPLDRVCPITTESVIFAELIAPNGMQISRSDTLVDIERHQTFPQAKLTLLLQNDYLLISSDRYAHCVELTGNEDGDEFGWYFEDNYFNLLPFEQKRVRIGGRHKRGTISAKAHFSNEITSIVCNLQAQTGGENLD